MFFGKKLHRLVSFFLSFNLVFQAFSPVIILAQEATQSAESPSETITPTLEPTATPSEEPAPTETITPTPTEELSSTPEPSLTPDITLTPTSTPSPEPSPTPSPTPAEPPVLVTDSSTNSLLASLFTDKLDYFPTDTVNLTGTGFAPVQFYTIYIASTDDPAVSHTGTVITNIEGNFTYSYTLDGNYRPNYTIEVRNEAGTVVASTTFTDTPDNNGQGQGGNGGNPSAELDQCGNGQVSSPSQCTGSAWQHGDLNANQAHYREGDSVPYRLIFGNLGIDSTNSVTIQWDITKSDKHATDYLTTYNQTESVGNHPCSGVSGCGGTPSTASIPADPSIGSVPQIPGVFTLFNGTITAVSGYTVTGTLGDQSNKVTINFTANSATPVLTWSGHIGSQIDWGAGNSASSINGSPYHMRLLDLNGSGGNQDRALSASAVPPVPTIATQVSTASVVINNPVTDVSSLTGSGQNPPSVTGNVLFYVCGPQSSNPDCSSGGTQVGSSVISGGQATSSNFIPTQAGNYCFRAEYIPDANAVYSPANHTNQATECFSASVPPTGTITVVKQTDPDEATQAFTFNLGGDATNTTSLSGGQSHTFLNLPAGSYALSEILPNGWSQTSATCDDQSPINNISLSGAENITCTFNNQAIQPKLTVTKVVTKDNGGTAVVSDFPLFVDLTQVTSGVQITTLVGPHTISETNLPGYTPTITGDCAPDGTITLALGDVKSCTITNDDIAPKLHLRKVVVNDNGGTATTSNFTVNADGTGSNDISGISPVDSDASLKADTFSLSEFYGGGYSSSDWVCVGGVQNGSSVTLGLGEEATCTITNDDIAPKLHLRKIVINDNGGTAVDTDWTLTANGSGTNDFSGTTPVDSGVSLQSDTFALSESGPGGYSASAWNCTDPGLGGTRIDDNHIYLNIGGEATCTITNDDIAPTLTLVKTVVNDNGGDKVISDFILKIDDSAVTSGQANTVSAGPHQVSEVSLVGYTPSIWTGDCSSTGSITLQPGENKTCYITNDDITPTLTFFKLVNNLYGGLLGASSFPLYVNSTQVASGQSNILSSGFFTLSEVQQPGYQSLGFSGDCALDGTITLNPGDNKSCTLTNQDIQPKLTVVKKVINDNGGILEISDSPLFVGSTAVTSGAATGFSAGSYTVGETNKPGYTATFSGACDANGTVNLSVGDNKTCTITNDDQPGTLIIKKILVGSTEAKENFSFQVNGATAIPFESDGQNNITVSAGTYSVVETPASNYSTAYDNCSQVVIGNGESATCSITNTKNGSISGKKFDDLNGDHMHDTTTTDPNLPDWTIYLDNNDNGILDPGEISTTTNSFGNYSFEDLTPGTYRVRELQKTGWLQTRPDADFGGQGRQTDGSYLLNLDAGGDIDGRDFGNFKYSSVSGYKWEDTNGDGIWQQEDESPLSDWTIYLGDEETTTDEDGYYEFTELTAGTYTLSEEPEGWQQTAAPDSEVIVTSGLDLKDQNFGNFESATIIVSKNVLGTDGDTDVSDETSFGIKLNDDNPQPISENTSVTYDNLLPGTYTITEDDPPAGYELISISDDQGLADGVVTVASGQTYYVDITNKQVYAKLIVKKHVINDNGGTQEADDFTINADGVNIQTSSFPGDEDGTEVLLDAGEYSVDETKYPGYSKTLDENCSGEVAFGDTVICTITNDDDAAHLIVIKQVVGSTDSPTTFNLHISGTAGSANFVGASDPGVNTPLSAGTYAVSEDAAAGYDTTYSADCTGSLVNGQTKTCTVSNTKRGHIIIQKNAVPDSSQVFGFTNNFGNNNPGTFNLIDDSTLGLPNYDAEVLPGKYSVSEDLVTGWQSPESTSCDMGETVDDIDVGPGETVTCTFTNEKLAKITLVKNTVGGDGTFDFDATGTDLPTDIDLTTVDGTVSQTFENLDPYNTYTLIENEPDGWDLTGSECTGTNNSPESITPNAGEEITCTFTNTKHGTITIVKDTQPDDDQAFRFTGDLGQFSLTDSGGEESSNSQTFEKSAGEYSVTEPAIRGWDLSSISCSNEQNVNINNRNVVINLQPGENIICTFTNTYVPPKLNLSKTNDALTDRTPGGSVTFTLTLSVLDNDVTGAKVIDLPAKGFTYRPGSWQVKIKGLPVDTIAEPQYHSPGKWNLGDLLAGDIVELSYIADIDSTQTPGVYDDLAWANGQGIGGSVTAVGSDGAFVSSDVKVIKDNQDTPTREVEKKETVEGQVLGATTLPATGADTAWLYLALILGLLGTTSVSAGIILKRKHE